MAGTSAMPPQEIASDVTDVRKEMSDNHNFDVQDVVNVAEVSADDDEFESEEESFGDADEALKEVREVEATTDIEKIDASDLLALSKSRLTQSNEEEEVVKGSAVAGGYDDDDESPRVEKKSHDMFELAIAKGTLAESLAETDPNLLLLAEKKVKEAQAKANVDEAMPPKPARSENSELWALLNHSKMRLETGKHEMGAKKTSRNSIRGDDAMSVTSKVSKSSKKSNEAPITVVGGPDEVGDAPLHDVNRNGYASACGSVSSASEMKNDDELDNNSDDDEDNGDEESSEEEEEEDLPSFLKDDNEDIIIDPEEANALYEAAKFKAASILSVTKDNLSDVQMLQAIAIAEVAAKKGEDKFSTKRSLFKLNEAKVEDLKALLNFSTRTPEEDEAYKSNVAREAVGWGIGKGRLIKKLGSVVQDFKVKCAEIDQKNQKERIETGQPTIQDVTSAAMLDLKAQIEEMEKIVSKTGPAF